MHISADPRFGGEWAWCRNCGFHGDMIELAARHWKLKVAVAVQRLLEREVLPLTAGETFSDLSDAATSTFDDRRRIEAFWERCREDGYSRENSALQALFRTFGLDSLGPDWATRGGQFVGGATPAEVDALIHPAAAAEKKSKAYQLFKGKDWKDLLVVPFYDLPGRISGFAFVGRNAGPEDVVYQIVPPALGNNFYPNGRRPLGVGMMEAALHRQRHPRLDTTLFVINDVRAAVRFQIRHMRENTKPLPLLINVTDARFASDVGWRHLATKELLFWGVFDPLASIRAARLAGGASVSIYQPTADELNRQLGDKSPVDWLYRAKLAAEPWGTALRKHLRNLPLNALADAVAYVGLAGPALEEFAAGCDAALKERLSSLGNRDCTDKTLRFGGREVTSTSGGWFDNSGDLIAAADFHIRRVLVCDGSDTFYDGVVNFQGATYPFREKAKKLDRGLFGWAAEFLRDTCQAGVLQYNPVWDRRGAAIATAFHPPVTVKICNTVGWSSATKCFHFPSFAVGEGGSIVDEPAGLGEEKALPARLLTAPTPAPASLLRLLSVDNPEVRIFWAFFAALASKLVAPVTSSSPPRGGILLAGDGARELGSIYAGYLGCLRRQCKVVDEDFEVGDIGRHNWPVLLGNGRTPKLECSPVGKAYAGVILPVSVTAWRVLSLLPHGWQVVRWHGKLGNSAWVPASAGNLLPAYIQHLAKKKFWIDRVYDDATVSLLYDVASWFEDVGGSGDVVREAVPLLDGPLPTLPMEHFVALVTTLYRDGQLTAGYEKHGETGDIIHTEKGLWLDSEKFFTAVEKKCGLVPPAVQLTLDLYRAGATLSDAALERDGRKGWLISNSWWQTVKAKVG